MIIDFTDLEQVKTIQANIRSTFDTPQGKEVMSFLEDACGWYDSVFDPDHDGRTHMNAGRREVLATIKTFLKHSPEHIVSAAKQKES